MRLFFLLLLAGSAWAQSADEILASVTRIHGGPGVFAVAGYRMGQRAARELGPSLLVVHHSPLQVQYSCVADGWQAATGVSAGKLTLRVEESDAVFTEVEDRKSGRRLRFTLLPAFLERYLDTPRAGQEAAARQVLELPDEQIFRLDSQ